MSSGGRLRLATEASFRATQSDREAQHVYEREVITFRLGEERYGLDIGLLREIVTLRPITEVPRASAILAGVITVRGVVAPVVDLRRRLGIPAAPADKRTRILIADDRGEPVGLLVDEVYKVVRLRATELEALGEGSGVASEMVAALGRSEQQLIILLALPAVLRFPLLESEGTDA